MTPARILVTGASGLLGSALAPALEAEGARVLRLGRRAGAGQVWDPEAGVLPRAPLEGLDAVIHLAGENLAAGRWTGARKDRLVGSRTRSTRLLAETLAALDSPPRVLVSASAIGYYGDRGDERLGEESPAGAGFLAALVRAWEEATAAAAARGIRVVRLRMAVVLTPRGGALARMLPPFRLGLGGRFGSGRQWMSWIALDDLVDAIRHCLRRDELSGAVNAASPSAVTQADFARTLGRVLGRPAVTRVPAALLSLALGEMAGETLLASQRVEPRRLLASGFRFRHPELEMALRHLLGRPPRAAGPHPAGVSS